MRLIRSTLSGVVSGTQSSQSLEVGFAFGGILRGTKENDMQCLKGAIQKVFCSVLRKIRTERVIGRVNAGAIDASVDCLKCFCVLLQSMTVTMSWVTSDAVCSEDV
jgi:hypothetical protein